MFFRMLLRSHKLNLRAKLMAILAIAMGSSLIVVMLNLWLDVGDKLGRDLKSYGSNIMVKPKAQSLPSEILKQDILKNRIFIDEQDLTKIKTIFWHNNILGFSPFLQAEVNSGKRSYQVIGTWFNKRLIIPTGETIHTGVKGTKPWWEINGSWISEQSVNHKSQVIVGKSLAKSLNLRVNDWLRFDYQGNKFKYKIAGILKAGGSEENQLYISLDELQRITNLKDKVSWVEVSALTTPENELARKYNKNSDQLSSAEFEKWYCSAFAKSIAFQIEEVIKGTEAKPLKQVADSESFILNKIQFLMALLAILAFTSAWLGVWSLMGAGVLERSKEIGLAKAIGASDLSVISLFLAEATLVGIIGGIAGYFIGIGLAQFVGQSVFERAVEIKLSIAPVAIIVSVLIALLGNFSVVSTIIRLQPKDILHGA